MSLDIKKAADMGACPGVLRAIKLVEEAAKKKGVVETLGPLVHNSQVMEHLARLGVKIVDNLEHLSGNVVVIPSHGVSPRVHGEIKARGLDVIDATCSIVCDAQRAARELASSGFKVIIFGDARHPEVQGLLGCSEGCAIATLDVQSITELAQHQRLGVLSQTTQSASHFASFVGQLTGLAMPWVQELRVMNTICDATRKRQDAALELAREVDVVLVVGGYNSANTKRLVDVCSASGVEVHHVETADEIKSTWIEGWCSVGLTAGASTPDWLVDEVARKLDEIAVGSIDGQYSL